jgi:adenine deaminase
MKVSGNIVDVLRKRIFPETIEVLNGRIAEITEDKKSYNRFITPGFIDVYVHKDYDP